MGLRKGCVVFLSIVLLVTILKVGCNGIGSGRQVSSSSFFSIPLHDVSVFRLSTDEKNDIFPKEKREVVVAGYIAMQAKMFTREWNSQEEKIIINSRSIAVPTPTGKTKVFG